MQSSSGSQAKGRQVEMKVKTRSVRKVVLSTIGSLLLVGMTTIVILALLGPSVGNVFSNIVSNCTNCGSGWAGAYTGSYNGGSAYQAYGDGYQTYGGTDPVNGEPYADMFFKHSGVNPFIDTEDDPLSTFALDVDTGSYAVTRRYLTEGYLPPAEAVRVEEFVNSFDYREPPPELGIFSITLEGGNTPFVQTERYRVIRIGIQGKEILEHDRKDAVLTFVVDTSGSMEMENRLGAVQQALARLVDELRSTDQVAIVAFGAQARVVLPATPASERGAIREAIYRLRPDGSTNAAEGLMLGYQTASRAFRPGAINRVILCSDGVANTGLTSAEDMLEQVRGYAEDGIHLATIGFGMGNYNDVLMERLANDGNGIYAYVDTPREAEKLFVEDLTGTLQTIAMDAKVQVSFNPETVSRYRLIGYENRALRDEDFRRDDVDAGEIGAGHDVTALYEVKLLEVAAGELAAVTLRWQDPDTGEVSELSEKIAVEALASSFEESSDAFRLAVLAAQFAEILRESYWIGERTLNDLTPWLYSLESLEDSEVWEFIDLVQRAALLDGEA
jgi:Ca-activated chloride channel family protein